jgi:preprotein translocase subunit SecF
VDPSPSPAAVQLTSLAAILTIMGTLINDKVVVYDRVRENLRK